VLRSFSIPGRKIIVSLHVMAWVFLIIIPLYLTNAFGGDDPHQIIQFYIHFLSAGIIFYLGYLWLVPKYFLQEKKITYLIILIGLTLITYFLTVYINDYILFDPVKESKFWEAMNKATGKDIHFRPPMKAFGFYNHILTSALISGFAIGLGVMDRLKQNEKRQKELEKEKLNSELAFLKNQISPHFFFNTLNNIYSLIGIDGPIAQESVLKLSKLMRYLLYESDQGETLISKEISFMNNYIDLMKLRLSPRVDLNIDFPTEFPDFSFPPLLFVPFIENAFKHGVNSRERSFIDLTLNIEEDKIRFSAWNSIGKGRVFENNLHTGIGLENVQKRLGLLFPGRYDLKIDQDETIFRVELVIDRGRSQL